MIREVHVFICIPKVAMVQKPSPDQEKLDQEQAAVKIQAVHRGTEMILGFASRYACLGDLDKWAASRLQVACK